MTDTIKRIAGLVIAAAISVLGCEETTPDNDIAQFDRAQDVALVCYHSLEGAEADSGVSGLGPLPLGCCENQGEGVDGYCDVPDPEAVLLAFVTQTTFGEVAVVDLDEGEIIDQDTRIPLNSFIPVGGQPSDIAASWDGSHVYTANFETEDVSVIDVAEAFGPTMVPASAIDIGGPGGRIAVAKAPSIRDRFLFVTQPTLGRVAVVQVGDASEFADGGAGDATPRLLGYLRLDAATALPHAPLDDTVEGIIPWAIQASEVTPSLYVGGKNGKYILEIDTEVLVNEALALDTPGPLSENAIVRRMELGDFTTRAFSIEPDLERWIYAVENELGGVIVLDLVTGELLPVNADNPIATDAYSIDIPGRARAISLVRLAEDDEPLPVTFDGTFGIVSSTEAAIFVIDAEDRNPIWGGPGTRHSLRSSAYWCTEATLEDAGTDDDDDDDDCVIPGIDDAPVLWGDDSKLSSHIAETIGTFRETTDGGLPECSDDGGVAFRNEGDYGIRMRCDYRITSNETWTLTWEGEIGVSGTGVAQFDAPETEDGALVVRDQSKKFCTAGVLGGADGVTIGFTNLYEGLSALETGSSSFPNGYPGDILEITSEPTPKDGAVCDQFQDVRLRYHVREMLDDDTLVIIPIVDSPYDVPLPSVDCFGQAFSYTIRSYGHWVLSGSKTGHLRYGVLDATTGQCLPSDHTDESEERAAANAQRVFEGVPFENRYLSFELVNDLGSGNGKSDYDEIYYSFVTSYGFSPMGATLGNDLTDIEPTPDDLLILIDQSSEGLIMFDLTGTFGMDGSSIN